MWPRQQNGTASAAVAPEERGLAESHHQKPLGDESGSLHKGKQGKRSVTPEIRPGSVTGLLANWEGGRQPESSLQPSTDQQPFRHQANAQSSGAGSAPSSTPAFVASIAQRRMQRRPAGLRLDNLNQPSLGHNGPPPTAHGTWTVSRQTTEKPLPPLPGEKWDDSAPSTPKAEQTEHASRPRGFVGSSVDPGNAGGACGTPLEVGGSLTSFQQQMGPVSFSHGGVVPSMGGPLVSKDTPSGSSGSSYSYGSSGSLARRATVRQGRIYPMSRVSGLHYIGAAEMADKLQEKGGVKRGLVIDMRRSAEYSASHIVSAISMAVPTTLVKRKSFVVERLLAMLQLTEEQRHLVANWKSASWVVLYGEGAPEEMASEDASLVLLARKFMSEACESCQVFVLQDGFKEFARSHPSLCEIGTRIQEAKSPAGVSLSLPPSAAAMPMMTAPLASSSIPLHEMPALSKPAMAYSRPMVDVDHPLLRTMRQTPGGGFDRSEIVAMRLPHDFSLQQQQSAALPDAASESQRLQALPDYLRRAADPKTGPLLLNSWFQQIDDSESRRISYMIGSYGMRTKYNKYTISAGLELGEKNRYKNIYPYDSNRVRLGSSRKVRDASDATAADFFSEEPTPAASLDGPMIDSPAASLQRLQMARPTSTGVIGARPTSMQTLEGTSVSRMNSIKRSSHQVVESKSKGQLLIDDIDRTSSESEFAGSTKQSKCDYVNASYIAYFDGPLYIATQGPLPDTVNDFWLMVWEEHSRVIVMLTKEFEFGRPKCHRYWPAHVGEATMYGDLRVEFQAEAQHPDDSGVIARRFRLTRPSVSKSSMCITHLQYVSWPDHGVPENPLGVLRLQQLARQAQSEAELQAEAENLSRIPMIVHCSAGCGRTGAFCVIDTVLSQDRLTPKASAKPAFEDDGDVIMGDASMSREHSQSYDKQDMFTGQVPHALQSQSSQSSLPSQQDTQMDIRTPEEELGESSNRRSLSFWNDKPPAELHEDRVFMVVSRFRELRITMVQTIKQFVFCHEALAWVALGAGPRPLDHVMDRRLVAEWNRKNHPEISEADRTDVTYLMRGRQEMVQAMLASELGGSGKNSANGSTAGSGASGAASVGRASIDVVSGTMDIDDGSAVVKRSNTVGPSRRWLLGSLFKPKGGSDSENSDSQSVPTSRVASRQRDPAQLEQQKSQPAVPPHISSSSSLGPRLGMASRSVSSQAPIAEEEADSEYASQGANAAVVSEPMQAEPALKTPFERPRLPIPAQPLPPPPLGACAARESFSDDYFGMPFTQVESPVHLVSAESNPHGMPAQDWRSMLGRLDAAGEIVARRRRGEAADSPRSPQPFMSSSALASPGAHARGLSSVSKRAFSIDAKQFPANKQRFIPKSGKYPQGFLAGGSHCGIKKNGKGDIAALLSDRPTTASAVFTTNQFCAAPVTYDRSVLNGAREAGQQRVRGVIVNSGCANAVTGAQGMADARAMAKAGQLLVQKIDGKDQQCETLVMSTGVIGQQLPMDKILKGVPQIEMGATHEQWMRAAIAHMTTDTFPKLLSRKVELSEGQEIRMAGITKGAGMIHPNMATLLGTVCTDAAITQPLLDKALAYAVARSFNAISIDGDMSTNDTIAVLANGAAGTKLIDQESSEYLKFRSELTSFMAELASLVVRDGEGATKFITVEVAGARSFADAKQVASTIATSSLVKAAFYGQDANWGRILCAVGYAGVPLDTAKVCMAIHPGDGSEPLQLVRNGEPLLPVDEVRASEILKQEDMLVRVELGLGNEDARMYTCDLSHDYVSINADYRS
ncbi:glutamate N-acetyltransferase [Coemansia sp. RSA 1085]|nr:glutamate N-acetyltransferase [Coemansia sp. RSA 1085]